LNFYGITNFYKGGKGVSYNTQAIKTDINGNPVPQGYEPRLDGYRPQTVSSIGDGKYAIDSVSYGMTSTGIYIPLLIDEEGKQITIKKTPLKILIDGAQFTAPSGSTARIDLGAGGIIETKGYENIHIGVQEINSTRHNFALLRKPRSIANLTSVGDRVQFAKFEDNYGGWEMIRVFSEREEIFVENQSDVDRTYKAFVALS
jgi:hypothetical protein